MEEVPLVQEQRLVNEFLELVQIDSESGNERAMCDNLIQKLDRLGFDVIEDRSAMVTGHNAGNLIATLYPTKNAQVEIPGIYFTSHMDTVVPGVNVSPMIKDGYIVSDGTTVLGSDDKAGLAAILEAVRVMKEQSIDHGLIQLIFTVGEESGLTGAKNIDPSLIKAKYGYAVDSNGPVGEIITSAVAQKHILLRIKGKSAHAGVNPENGVSAVQIASRAISRLRLGRVDHDTTANIGIIRGGKATNIIPDSVEIGAEVRSHDHEKLDRYTDKMVEVFKTVAQEWGGAVNAEVTELYPAYHFTERDLVVKNAIKAVKKVGREAAFRASGGGSDANIFASFGIPTVNLAIGYENIHTTHERMPILELRKAAELILAIIKESTKVTNQQNTHTYAHV